MKFFTKTKNANKKISQGLKCVIYLFL